MSLLTPDTLLAAYEYLRTTKPFADWNLPDGEDVFFRVGTSRCNRGTWRFDGHRHCITISSLLITKTESLMYTMAHEMIHVHEFEVGTYSRKSAHNDAFSMFASEVCMIHGFDRGLF